MGGAPLPPYNCDSSTLRPSGIMLPLLKSDKVYIYPCTAWNFTGFEFTGDLPFLEIP